MLELGFPGFEVYSWQAFAAPRGLPKDIRSRMEGAVVSALKLPQVRQSMDEIGFEVKHIAGLNRPSATAIAETTIKQVVDAVKAIDGDDVDAIIQCGTNLSCVDIFPTLEHWLEKPLIPINVATIWHALRACGIQDQVIGRGRLMEEF